MRDNSVQQLLSIEFDLLNSFLGEEGSYFETILDYQDVDIGTKCIFLKKALSEDCDTFLRSLDKLYFQKNNEAEETTQMEFIVSLKFINDVCFNNYVLYGDFGIRSVIKHYFSLGRPAHDISSPIFFRQVTQKIILKGIQALEMLVSEEELTRQKIAWGVKETDGLFSIKWRSKIDLPLSQKEYFVKDRRLEILILINNACSINELEITQGYLKKHGVRVHEVAVLEAMYFLIVYFKISLSLAIAEVSGLNAIQADVLRYGYEYGIRKINLIDINTNFPAYTIALKLILQNSLMSENQAMQEVAGINKLQALTLCELAALGLRSDHLKMFGDEFSIVHANALIFFIKQERLPVEYFISNTFLLNRKNILLLEKDYKKLPIKNKTALQRFISKKYSLYCAIKKAGSLGDAQSHAIGDLHHQDLQLSSGKATSSRSEIEKSAVNVKKVISDIIVNYMNSRTSQTIKVAHKMNFEHRFFRGYHRNKDKTQKKLINANELSIAILNCRTLGEIKSFIKKSIDSNHSFEKNSWNPFTKSHYARELQQCNKIIDVAKTQMTIRSS